MKATVEGINQVIRNAPEDFKKGQVSDGYHTFDELYDHRIQLWITATSLMKECNNLPARVDGIGRPLRRYTYQVWRSQKHDDGQLAFGGGWFVLGVNVFLHSGGIGHSTSMTYHLPISYWDQCDFAETFEQAPPFDGHTSQDVLERLKNL